MENTAHRTIKQQTIVAPVRYCDICDEEIQPGEKFYGDDEIGCEHKSCADDWFRRNFGREGLS